ncbi:MAG TPA: zinc metalloprotease HtpX [Candidatus Thermoplasmatota archaeon]|nr:zinc metalloprotease HtpX [Candidatus Thermoplasmatota archaeon]
MGFARTMLLFAVMTAMFVAVGWVVGGLFAGDPLGGMATFLLLALGLNAFSYFFSDKLVLRIYGARVVSPQEAPRLHAIVDDLAARYGIPKPRVALVPSPTPNAFATGRNPRNAVVAATEGILRLLDDRELAGVLAHELAHVRNRDVLTSTVAATLAGAIAFAGRTLLFAPRDRVGGGLGLLAAIVAPVAALLVQLGIGRSREFAADADGAHLHGDPLALASALQKLEAHNQARPMRRGSPATANLFIVNPFRAWGVAGLFSTHPPTAERVRRLHVMAQRSRRA